MTLILVELILIVYTIKSILNIIDVWRYWCHIQRLLVIWDTGDIQKYQGDTILNGPARVNKTNSHSRLQQKRSC